MNLRRPISLSAASLLAAAAVPAPPVTPVAPSPAPAITAGGLLTSTLESQSATFTLDSDQQHPATLRLEKSWQACDVFVSLESPPSAASQNAPIRIYVFAVTQATGRTLVASGNVRPFDVATLGTPVSPKWAAAARSEGQFYEVQVEWLPTIANGVKPKATVTVVGSNNTATPPSDVGSIQFFGTDSLIWSSNTLMPFMPRARLGALEAFTTANAAARYLQVFDLQGIPAPGAVPIASFALPPSSGVGLPGPTLVIPDVGYRARNALCIRASSTPDTLTNSIAGDVFITAQVK